MESVTVDNKKGSQWALQEKLNAQNVKPLELYNPVCENHWFIFLCSKETLPQFTHSYFRLSGKEAKMALVLHSL